MEVASSATWVGTNETTTDHAYAGGGYDLEVKIPMADPPGGGRPRAHRASTSRRTTTTTTRRQGSTTLRHIDASTRLAWSAFGSVQSDPYRWGHATLAGYTPPADRPTTPEPPNVSNPNLNGVDSPQTIAQSARDGVPISGRVPAPAQNRIATSSVASRRASSSTCGRTTGPGARTCSCGPATKGYIPVWVTSCALAADPPPDYGMTACALGDGTVPPWSPDMSGRVVRDQVVQLRRPWQT